MTAGEEIKKLVGRAEKLSFPEQGLLDVHARIDTGAKTSSIWVSEATIIGSKLHVVFLGKDHPAYTGQTVTFDDFDSVAVSTSTGEVQSRYKVRLLVKLKGKKVRAWFTLADRSTQVYPVLIGRNVLLGKFIVDVKKGHVLKEEEQRRSDALRASGTPEKEEI